MINMKQLNTIFNLTGLALVLVSVFVEPTSIRFLVAVIGGLLTGIRIN